MKQIRFLALILSSDCSFFRRVPVRCRNHRSHGVAGRFLAVAAAMIVVLLMLAQGTRAASPSPKSAVAYTFAGGPDGNYPLAGLVFDTAGNLYGTTSYGGDPSCWSGAGCGTVFKLTKGAGGTWSKSVLHSFNYGDGAYPYLGDLVLDPDGNLYGTTGYGGTYTYGVVFQLAPLPDGSWSFRVLYEFTGGSDGGQGLSVIRDDSGNLYGLTYTGGSGNGVVFKLSPNPDGSWTENVLHTFNGDDGSGPHGALTLDVAGNLYGSTLYGGTEACGCGTVYELQPLPDGSWKQTVLHSFTGGNDGSTPPTGVIVGNDGNLYGGTQSGGAYGSGVVYKLVRGPQGVWKETVLHIFMGGNDGQSAGNFLSASAGFIYGTTDYGGVYGAGTLYTLTPQANGTWKKTILHHFTGGTDGYRPVGKLAFDAAGTIFAPAQYGGHGYGVVWALRP